MNKFFRITFIIVVTMVLLISSSIFYAFKIEPYRLQVNSYNLSNGGTLEDTVKIVQISDIHLKEDYSIKELNKIVNKLNRLNPDLVIFTGDLYDNYGEYNNDEEVISQLSKIDAKYGKLAVWGNHDYGGGGAMAYEEIMERSGFKILNNESSIVNLESGKSISISGIDDAMLGNPILYNNTDNEIADYSILMSHEPDSAVDYMNNNYNLILCGHSHGGQIDIPFIPQIQKRAINVTTHASLYDDGLYDIDNENKTKFYVNTGLGTTHISARFGVVPEIAEFNIKL